MKRLVYSVLLMPLFFGGLKPMSTKNSVPATIYNEPNIIVILSDDHAYQAIGAYGNKIARTNNIDRLAKEGAILKNQFVTNSICGPSRATFLTGKYSHLNGYKANEGNFNIIQQLFPSLLSHVGYQTAWIGKWHLGTLPGKAFDYWDILPNQGFYYNPDFINKDNDTARFEGYVTDIITEKAKNWLNNRDKNKPFFMVVGEKATHREWLPDIQDLGAYDNINFPIPSTFFDQYKGRMASQEQKMSIAESMELDRDLKVHVDFDKFILYERMNTMQRKAFSDYYIQNVTKDFDLKKPAGNALAIWKYQRYMKDYFATANSLDRNIGEILKYLDEEKLSKNTIVIYLSDQGFYLGEHGWFDKRFMYEESLRTPFIIRYPKKIRAGIVINNMVSNIDWAPTILDMAGSKIPIDMQGKSFWSVLQGKKDVNPNKEVFYHYYEYPGPHFVSAHFGMRTLKYKLIRFYGKKNYWEFYDLNKDPKEQFNAIRSKYYSSVISDLKKRLRIVATKYKDTQAVNLLDKV